MNGELKHLHCRLSLRERKLLAKVESIAATQSNIAIGSLQAPKLPFGSYMVLITVCL